MSVLMPDKQADDSSDVNTQDNQTEGKHHDSPTLVKEDSAADCLPLETSSKKLTIQTIIEDAVIRH